MLQKVLQTYGLDFSAWEVKSFGSGLINNTWKVSRYDRDTSYILQRINQHVFKSPEDIAHNIRIIGAYLAEHHPDYLFVRNLYTNDGTDIFFMEGEGYFRLVPFIKKSHTVDVVQTPQQAFEAAKQFGRFTHLLNGFPVDELKVTIPDFHNLSLRYRQFLQSLQSGNPLRIEMAEKEINWLKAQDYIAKRFDAMKQDPDFKLRVTHHDTKISNVLFDEHDKGLCVIDLDTVMPGYFISDVGDMMRTCLSPVSEEEKDFSKIEIREEYYKAIVEGYLKGMENELSTAEKAAFFDAACYLVYMQALRFIADHLNNDEYYGARYEGHNFTRGSNQISLLKKLLEKEHRLRSIV
ncbi:aminoglycoside phosphotransferase family protein [Agriterribacter sp.]|uniref:phosphotransferase enzyme family protein n=1 Tax=Agriterribacter sp. TaxID=2821509 RepID=UPI002C77FF2C|nr:aminoglycoside phosphotransferase family protein [Agriterribacter sp.]HRP56493.1 aminoglycoside phosphotransferase family protein [Agriterribacter sp.]